jgi:predicted RNA-binding Zn-ribbon protein involved in translation (DUF1610 family)
MPMSANIFNFDVLEEFEVETLLNELGGNGSQAQAICPHCGADITDADYECPSCGVILKVAPKRKTAATRELLQVIESENMNGDYHIYKLPDGTLHCDCFSFLFQKGVREEYRQTTCKHIRKFIEGQNENTAPELRRQIQQEIQEANFLAAQPLTNWQKVLLKKLGIVPHEKLSREQAYWIVRDLLSKMGVEYREFVKIVKENPTYELLPLYSYGVELEGLIRSRDEMYEKMKTAGFKVKKTGYSHELENKLWKVGDDGSVRNNMNDDERRNYVSMELTSPKLFGEDGFKDVKKVLDFWAGIGGAVNNSCGFHVHVDAWNYILEDLLRLLLVWTKIEPVVYFLVSPSRRHNNTFAKMWRRENALKAARIFLGIDLNPREDRYYALNRVAFEKYRTVEFRIHQGTMNMDKVKYWTVFCLKLVEKVKHGLKWYHFSEEPTLEEVLEKVGIVENAIPIIRQTRKYLLERYAHFRSEYGDGNHDLPKFEQAISLLEFKSMIKSMDSIRNFPIWGNSKGNLFPMARVETNNLLPFVRVAETRDGNTFRIPSASDSGRTYKVKYNPENETVTCSCAGFRARRRCWHAVSVARYLIAERLLNKAENNMDF